MKYIYGVSDIQIKGSCWRVRRVWCEIHDYRWWGIQFASTEIGFRIIKTTKIC